ncbi:MAG: type II toxin-antitoxin system PemK/MazF family toxin [Nanoarchaeota archaeon]
MIVKQRDLVLVSYPFSDVELSKVRPAIVISNDDFNRDCPDCLLVPLTSVLKNAYCTLEIHQEDLESGKLLKPSKVRAGKFFTMNQQSIMMNIGKVKQEFFTKLKKEVIKVF